MLIKARNLLDIDANRTHLAQSSTIGAATLYVKNINGFVGGWGIQLGKTGEEKSEVVVLGSATPTGTALVLNGTAKYDHPADCPIYAIKYDQILFKRSTAGTSGTATIMTDGTVTIQADSDYTVFDDTSGSTTYAYKAAYYSSYLGEASSDSDWIMTSGFSFYSLAKIRERIKNKLESANYIKTDSVVDDWINEWLEKMTNTMIDVNKDYAITTTDISFSGTTELGTITATDFKEARKIWYTEDGSDWFQMIKMDLNDFDPFDVYSSTHPYFYYQGDNVIGRKPADTSGTARVYYYKTSTILDDDTDELPVAMRNYTKSFVDYALSQAYYLDGKKDLGREFMASALVEMNDFKKQIAPRHKTGPQYIDLVAPVRAEEDSEFM